MNFVHALQKVAANLAVHPKNCCNLSNLSGLWFGLGFAYIPMIPEKDGL
jgi:hypothetical protein